jgi:hypothetical protein
VRPTSPCARAALHQSRNELPEVLRIDGLDVLREDRPDSPRLDMPTEGWLAASWQQALLTVQFEDDGRTGHGGGTVRKSVIVEMAAPPG